MIYLTASYKQSVQSADGALHELGLGYMQTPQAGVRLTMLSQLNAIWAADNGCFSQGASFNLASYLAWLTKLKPVIANCLFATAPDVVADAEATWKRSESALPLLRQLGYKAALVAQDGIETMPIVWDAFDCLFIGGTTEWKLSETAYKLTAEAKKRGKWAHMGRVNSRKRLIMAAAGGYDSADGTSIAFGPDKRLPQLVRWLREVEALRGSGNLGRQLSYL